MQFGGMRYVVVMLQTQEDEADRTRILDHSADLDMAYRKRTVDDARAIRALQLIFYAPGCRRDNA
jgi:hypothetical protein